MLELVDARLPGSTAEAVRRQIALTLQPPYEAPITVAVNGALMSSAWFFLPAGLRDKVFTLHGTLAFALILAAWMYSDVPSTNVLGPDAGRVVAALDDPVMFRRLLYAKNIVLWLMVTPLCAVVAVINGLINHSLLSTVLYSRGNRRDPLRFPGHLRLGRDPIPVPPDANSISVGASSAPEEDVGAMAHPCGHSLRPCSDAGRTDAGAIAPFVGLHLATRAFGEIAGS